MIQNFAIGQSHYSDFKKIGEGAFGVVYKALLNHTKEVAIKKIKFQNSEQGVPPTALREISLLKNLKDHPNIVNLVEVIYQSKQKNLCLIFQYFQFDLKRFLQVKTTALTKYEVKLIIFQIINATAYCHGKKIIHRDLKPQNILIDSKGNIKVADFGLARILPLPSKTLTHQIQTVWYRAPEILLGQKKYNFSVDVWAIGCIFAELVQKTPLFPGKGHEIEQIFKIFQYLGTPQYNQLNGMNIQSEFPDLKPTFPKWKKTNNLYKNFQFLEQEGIDLLTKMLIYDPSKRITAQAALKHQYFKDLKSQDLLKYNTAD